MIALNDIAVSALVTAACPEDVSVVLNAPCTVEVVVVTFPLHVTEPPLATCAKLGCPPAACVIKLPQVMLAGFVG